MDEKVALRLADSTMKRTRGRLALYYEPDLLDSVMKEAREGLLPVVSTVPYVGGNANPYSKFLDGAPLFLSFHRTLAAHGMSPEDSGRFIFRAFRANLAAYPGWAMRLVGMRVFMPWYRVGVRRRAAESQKRTYPGDWVYRFVEGSGRSFAYGIDFEECGTCKFYHSQGADELSAVMCAADYLQSEAMGYGLARSKAIGYGDAVCDFRFRMGGKTEVPLPDYLKDLVGELY